jgi:chromosome segregation ATPase
MFRRLLSWFRPQLSPAEAPALDDALPAVEWSDAPSLDVEGLIRQASTRVPVEELLRRGKRHLHLLSAERIEELINRSVQTIFEKYRTESTPLFSVPETQFVEESKAEFNELLQQYRETSQAKSEIEKSKQALDLELEKLRKELEAEKASRSELSARPADLELLAAFDECAALLERRIDGMFQQRRLLLERSESPEAATELQGIEETLRTVLKRILDVERKNFGVLGDEQKEIALLRKRIDKLTQYIATLENGLKTLSGSKLYTNQQVQNLVRQLGLAQEDKYFEKKKEMLRFVLDANQEIRKKAKDLEEKGITLATPGGSPSAPAALATLEWSLGTTA